MSLANPHWYVLLSTIPSEWFILINLDQSVKKISYCNINVDKQNDFFFRMWLVYL